MSFENPILLSKHDNNRRKQKDLGTKQVQQVLAIAMSLLQKRYKGEGGGERNEILFLPFLFLSHTNH